MQIRFWLADLNLQQKQLLQCVCRIALCSCGKPFRQCIHPTPRKCCFVSGPKSGTATVTRLPNYTILFMQSTERVHDECRACHMNWLPLPNLPHMELCTMDYLSQKGSSGSSVIKWRFLVKSPFLTFFTIFLSIPGQRIVQCGGFRQLLILSFAFG